MNRFRPIILAFVVVLSALLAYGLWTQPQPRPADAQGFSAARVVKDIEVISKENHSVAHPEERARVREYLIGRLEGLGADTVTLFDYDSLVSPKDRPFVYTFDATDILAEFPPMNPSDDDTYLMFVAHYDSRYAQIMPKDTVKFSLADGKATKDVQLKKGENLVLIELPGAVMNGKNFYDFTICNDKGTLWWGGECFDHTASVWT